MSTPPLHVPPRQAGLAAVPWRDVLVDAARKLTPRRQVRNPVMFVVWVGAVLTTGLGVHATVGAGEAPAGFIWAVTAWLWFRASSRRDWPTTSLCVTATRR